MCQHTPHVVPSDASFNHLAGCNPIADIALIKYLIVLLEYNDFV